MDKSLEKQLHDLIRERQELEDEKEKVNNDITYIEGLLLLPEHNNDFNKKRLLMRQKEYQKILSKLDNITKRFYLLCTKLRIVKIDLKQDSYLNQRVRGEILDEAINDITCYGCVETGGIFEGPDISGVPSTDLDRFEDTAKVYKAIRSSK